MVSQKELLETQFTLAQHYPGISSTPYVIDGQR
jgi:hypothetical protein